MRFWAPAAVAAYFLFFFQLTGMGLVGPDEPRYAWIGREMARSGDWVTPRLYGDPWFEKPALLYWMEAVAFRAGLGDDAAPRVPVACLSVLFLVFFYRRMKAEFGLAAARYGTGVLATSAGWVAYSHAAVFDIPLAATLCAAMLCLMGRAVLLFAGLLGASMLAKGLVGPVLAALTIVCSSRATVKALIRPGPVIAFLAVAAPWYILCFVRNGWTFPYEFFWKHHVTRFAIGAMEHNQPIWYFLPALCVGLLPWTPLYFHLARANIRKDPRLSFLLWWALVTVLFFSLSRDKLPGYILPSLPPLSALVGIVLADKSRPMRNALLGCAILLAFFPAVSVVLPEALSAGLSDASAKARFPAWALAAVAALAVAVWAAERAGRRPIAVAFIAAFAVAGYAWIKQTTFPAIDLQAGTRAMWLEARKRGEPLCLGDVRRHVAYGLDYYAGRPLPSCEDVTR